MYTIFFARLVIDIVQTPWKSACAHERKHANNTHHLSAAIIHRALYMRSMHTHVECQKLCTNDDARTVAANKPSADAHNSFSERRASVRVHVSPSRRSSSSLPSQPKNLGVVAPQTTVHMRAHAGLARVAVVTHRATDVAAADAADQQVERRTRSQCW